MAEPRTDDADAYVGAQEALQDARLVERVLRGDGEACGELVSRHMRRAFSIAFRIAEHREDAEDVVQDAFVRALEHLHTLPRGTPFKPWLFRIVINQALNLVRARRVRATDEIPAGAASHSRAPDDDAANAELRGRLRAALAALPERQRVIVQLADLEDMSSTEIGDLLDIADGTVRWHLHQARRTLRAALGEELNDD